MPQHRQKKQAAKKAFAFGIISKIKKKEDGKKEGEEDENENERKKKEDEEEKEKQEHQELLEMAKTMPVPPKGKRRFIDILLEKKQQRLEKGVEDSPGFDKELDRKTAIKKQQTKK